MSKTLFPYLTSVALLLGACSGGGDDTTATGELSLVLTDAASDELSQFEVDVRDVVFTKLSGNTVHVMPQATRIDFVQLQALNELVTGLSLEAGIYTGVSLELDFSNAEVVIAGASTPATVLGRTGNPITGAITVDVTFPSGSRPVVRALRNNLFVFDLELDQGVVVDGPHNQVTFTPVLGVEVAPSNPKPIATTGLLHSVDTNALAFEVERRALDNSVLGTFTVQAGTATAFQLDGAVLSGAPGLGALTGYIGQRVFVQGTMLLGSSVLRAVAVETGAGVPGNGQDWVFGHVVARSGGAGVDPVLTVLGRSVDIGTATRHYNTAHTVQLSHANTHVLRRGAGNGLDSDAINIGQLVWVFGDLDGTALDASATTGVARLLPTDIFGVATAAPSNDTLVLDLVRFGPRVITAFDFDVSGQVQADPVAYEIDVTGIGTAGIGGGAKVHVEGFVRGVGSAQPDAEAFALTNRTVTAQLLFCQWLPATAGVVDGSSPAGKLVFDVRGAAVPTVLDGFGTTTLANTPAPSLAALGTLGLYRIIEDGAIEANLSFDQFRSSLLLRAAANPVFRISALGTFAASTQVFSALTTTVILD